MFNDVLSDEECQSLLKRLAGTAFPFQCAHGRPSMVPLVDLGQSEPLGADPTHRETDGGFSADFKRWRSAMGSGE